MWHYKRLNGIDFQHVSHRNLWAKSVPFTEYFSRLLAPHRIEEDVICERVYHLPYAAYDAKVEDIRWFGFDTVEEIRISLKTLTDRVQKDLNLQMPSKPKAVFQNDHNGRGAFYKDHDDPGLQRLIRNEDEVLAFLRKSGYEVCFIDNIKKFAFRDIMAAYWGADLVIGSSGSHIANTIVIPNKTHVIASYSKDSAFAKDTSGECIPNGVFSWWHHKAIEHYPRVFGHDYTTIIDPTPQPQELKNDPAKVMNFNSTLNIEVLAEIIRNPVNELVEA